MGSTPNRKWQPEAIQDPLSWFFLLFGSQPINKRFVQMVINLAQTHEGMGWHVYNRLFRLQKASNTKMPWTSLMAAAVSGQSCSSSDHAASSCAWKPTTPQATPPSQTPPLQANSPGQLRPSIKRSLNKVEHCPFAGGKFSHKCQTMGHPEYQCPSKLRQTVRLSLTCVYTC